VKNRELVIKWKAKPKGALNRCVDEIFTNWLQHTDSWEARSVVFLSSMEDPRMKSARIPTRSSHMHQAASLFHGARILTTVFIFMIYVASAANQSFAAHAQGDVSAPGQTSAPDAASMGLSFIPGSSSTVMIEHNGKKYLVDLLSHTIKELPSGSNHEGATLSEAPKNELAGDTAHQKVPAAGTSTQKKSASEKTNIYEAGDDYLFSLPTGRRLDRHGFYVNFNHRFAFDPAFTGPARGAILGGLDGFGIASFGLRYGITDKFSVSAYRSPSVIGRPIQLMASYNFLDEHNGEPFNAALRFSVEGRNNFSNNFTVNFEGIVSRSLTKHAQVYVVPTVSLDNRRLLGPQLNLTDSQPDLPGINTFSIGFGGALDIRPTVALVAEVIPTLVNGPDLRIHRPAFSFGIQKKIWRHAFTFGFTNSPGTTVSQRAGTRATFIGNPSGDTPANLFVGFDLTRQIY